MTLEQLVPTLEVCQQLKAAGFPQDSALQWYPTLADDGESEGEGGVVWPSDLLSKDAFCAAPTAGELIAWIEARFPKANLVGMPGVYGWHWRIWREGDLDENEPLDAYSKNSDVEQLAALVLEVAG